MTNPLRQPFSPATLRLTIVALLGSVISLAAAAQVNPPAPGTGIDTGLPWLTRVSPEWIVSTGGLLLTVAVLMKMLANREKDARAMAGAMVQLVKDTQQLVREANAATLQHAVAVARNTDAMYANTRSNDKLAVQVQHCTESNAELASEVRTLAERRAGFRDGDPT